MEFYLLVRKHIVMGVDWRDKFFASLPEDDQNEIKFLQPQNLFKVGEENPVSSIEKVEFI